MKRFVILMALLVSVALVVAIGESAESGTPAPLKLERDEAPADSSFFGSLFGPLLSQARSLLGQGGSALSSNIDGARLKAYKVFLQLYNKTYSPDELQRRARIFFQRRANIEESIRRFREGKSLFAMGENAFTDWDDEELKKLTGVSPPHSPEELLPEEREAVRPSRRKRSLNGTSSNGEHNDELVEDEDGDDTGLLVGAQIPARKDWRESGCVSTPINQLKCGACYAIATMSVVETMRCLNRNSAPILSPQQIVDCSTPRAGYQNFGCDGGWPTRVLKYLQDTGLATRESCYPFVRRQQACQMRSMRQRENCIVAASPTDQSRIQYKVLNNERDILYHVANTGPVVTVMKATDSFLYYARGIFDDPKCSRHRDDVDHAIVIVGYGRENNVNYWLIKNSWGTTTWGEGGYGKFKRDTNACSIGHWGWVVLG